jgi:LmbE family N-acetylglucosaminyl deacetylase
MIPSTLHLGSSLFVVSPHLDDAVFGCGAWLADTPRTIVCTVFAGTPPHDMRTDWDAQSGFGGAHEAMRVRLEEDRRALGIVGARPMHLSFLDSQYRDGAPSDVSSRALAIAVEEALTASKADTFVMPLGLFHSDHRLVSDACCEVMTGFARHVECFAYEDALYRRMPGLVRERLASLAKRHIHATLASPDAGRQESAARRASVKRKAIHAYASQLRTFGSHGFDDVFATERYWRLSF